jgi:TonB-linked SusC/RagA family outer membrane protein
LKEIERQTGLSFIYEKSEINGNKLITQTFRDTPVEKVLSAILDENMDFTIRNKMVMIHKKNVAVTDSGIRQQESRRITGSVIDADGEPMAGSTVTEKGTTNGTITDINGNFSLDISPGATLQVSFIGYVPQEIVIRNQTNLKISLLEDYRILDEVVVIGFGTQKKVNLTGAVGTVSSKDLQNRPVANVQQALQGLVPGLNIANTNGMLDATPSLNIRGLTTIGQGSSGGPLVLIDGTAGDLSLLNPQDIESVSVLKDAAASSIYGSRAPFGVILITTKQGDSEKIQVNYSNNFRLSAPTIRPEPMDSYTLATFMNDAHANSHSTPYISDERLQRIKDYQAGILKSKIPIDPDNPSRWLEDGYSHGNANNNIYDIVYKDWAFAQEHNMSASGGNKNFTFYMSLGYLDRNGLLNMANDNYKRYTPVGKIEARMTDWMKLSYTSRFVRVDYDRPVGLTNSLYDDLMRQGWSFLPLIDDNGNIAPGSQLMAFTSGRYVLQADRHENRAAMVLEPVKNWITNAEINYNVRTNKSYSTSLQMYIYDIAGNPYRDNLSSGSIGESFYRSNYLNVNLYSNYTFVLKDAHNFGVMAGVQLEQEKYENDALRR